MSEWMPIETAPRDGTDILVFHKIHGPMSARFCPGEWSEHYEYGPEYDGPVWCFGDGAFQEEIEEMDEHGSQLHHGPVTHWQPLPPAPEATP
jgi:hypothetical protein